MGRAQRAKTSPRRIPGGRKCKKLHQICRGDLRSPEVVSVTAAHPSIAQKRDLQEPSPMEKVPRNEADEVLVT